MLIYYLKTKDLFQKMAEWYGKRLRYVQKKINRCKTKMVRN